MTVHKMSLSNAVISAVLIVISTSTFVAVGGSGTHSCFVCTDDGPRRKAELHNLHKLFPGKKLAKCSQYDPAKRDNFVYQCPPGYNGCMTTFAGSSGIRGCSQLAVDSCEEVNGLMHCYCTADACNNPSKKLSDPVAMRNRDFRGSQYLDLEDDTDDDDDDDYSAGYGDDEVGSGDYVDYSDTTDAPLPDLEVDDDDTPTKLTDNHRESVNDLDFDEGADKEEEEEEGGPAAAAEKDKKSPAGSNASQVSLSVTAVLLAILLARL